MSTTRNTDIMTCFAYRNSFYYLRYGSKYLDQVLNSIGNPVVLFSTRVVAENSALLLKIVSFRDVGELGLD